MARPTGFEPVTPAFGGQYSIQLSYGRIVWAAHSTANRRAHECGAVERNCKLKLFCAPLIIAAI